MSPSAALARSTKSLILQFLNRIPTCVAIAVDSFRFNRFGVRFTFARSHSHRTPLKKASIFLCFQHDFGPLARSH